MLSHGTLFYAPPVAGSLPSMFSDVACPAVLGLVEPRYGVPFTATERGEVDCFVSVNKFRGSVAASAEAATSWADIVEENISIDNEPLSTEAGITPAMEFK